MLRLSRPSPGIRATYRRVTGRAAPAALLLVWPWWVRGFCGLTLGPLVLVNSMRDVGLVCHELQHVAQFYRHPLTFYPRYLYGLWCHGYRAHPFELEAAAVGRAAQSIARSGARSDSVAQVQS